MSGRDVRRIAARASTSSHQDKQLQVTRIVLGALENGVDHITLIDEPFRISRRAVENLPYQDQFDFIRPGNTHTAMDTVVAVSMMQEQGCDALVVLGGDGTNRIVAKTWPDAVMLPLSTGTNNVFPKMLEASVAGAAAGLVAAGRISLEDGCRRAKVVHIRLENGEEDLALVDAVMLRNEILGNFLPFDAERLADVVLSIAEPASVGISPIGGYLMPSYEEDDFGVHVQCGEPATQHCRVPISPGLYQDVPIKGISQTALDENVTMRGPGIIAFDGDRTIQLKEGESASCWVSRDGPWVIDAEAVMRQLPGLLQV